jgi:hypothetical protein
MEALSDILASLVGLPALAILVAAALTLFLTSDWRLSLTALLVEYLSLGLLLLRFVPLGIALAKIVTGAFVVAVLYLTARRMQDAQVPVQQESNEPRFLGLQVGWGAGPLGLPLRLMAVLLLLLGLLRLFSDYGVSLVSIDMAFAASLLAGMGMLGLLLSSDMLRVASSLLSVLLGFDLVYTRMNPNLATAGMLAVLYLLSALAFSYLASVQGLARAGRQPKEASEA